MKLVWKRSFIDIFNIDKIGMMVGMYSQKIYFYFMMIHCHCTEQYLLKNIGLNRFLFGKNCFITRGPLNETEQCFCFAKANRLHFIILILKLKLICLESHVPKKLQATSLKFRWWRYLPKAFKDIYLIVSFTFYRNSIEHLKSRDKELS